MKLFLIILIFISLISMFGWDFSSPTIIFDEKEISDLAKRLENHVYILSHEIGDRSLFKYDKLLKAENYITEQFRSYGYDVQFQEYEILHKTVKNIIATKVGLNQNEVVIVGAHYDTKFNPGADDNASAVAGLLELAKALKNENTNCNIKFIAFVNEEPPFYKTKDMGSRRYAKEAREKKESIKSVLILEMIGYYSNKIYSQMYPPFFGFFYPNKGNFISVVGNFKSHWLTKKIVANFKHETNFPIKSISSFSFVPGVDFSDHASFWKEGFPAVMITDTAFYRNRNYHSKKDTYETLNYKSMALVVNGLKRVIINS